MMNNLQRRRMQNPNLMQQGQNMLLQQQQDFNNWYDIGNSIGGAFFPNMANGTKDGQYQGQDLTKMDGYDKNISDKENAANLLGNKELSGAGQDIMNNAMYGIAQNGDNYVYTDQDDDKNISLKSFVDGMQKEQLSQYNLGATPTVFTGNQSMMNVGSNNIGYNSNYLRKLRGGY